MRVRIVAILGLLLISSLTADAQGTAGQVFRGNLQRTGYYGPNVQEVLSGTVLRFQVPEYPKYSVAACSPAILDGVVYFASLDSNYYAVEIAGGTELWRLKMTKGIFGGSPEIEGDLVYLPGPDSLLRGVDRQTGEVKQQFAARDIVGGPAILDGRVYFGSQDKYLYAYEIETGTLLWKFKTGGLIPSSPAIADSLLYFGSYDGYFYALNLTDGKLKWKFKAGSPVETTPAVDDARVFFGTVGGRIFAVNAGTGKKLWDIPICSKGPARSPAVHDGVVYCTGHDGNLRALNAATGKEQWKFSTDGKGPCWSAPALAGDMVYFGSGDSCFHALWTSTGKESWISKSKFAVYSTPVIVDGTVYFGTIKPGGIVGLK
jgi:eukaryotic-like serine/threonine-protein kinase